LSLDSGIEKGFQVGKARAGLVDRCHCLVESECERRGLDGQTAGLHYAPLDFIKSRFQVDFRSGSPFRCVCWFSLLVLFAGSSYMQVLFSRLESLIFKTLSLVFRTGSLVFRTLSLIFKTFLVFSLIFRTRGDNAFAASVGSLVFRTPEAEQIKNVIAVKTRPSGGGKLLSERENATPGDVQCLHREGY
jgi:hypothetical protein